MNTENTSEKIAVVMTASGRKIHVLNQERGFNTLYGQCGAKINPVGGQKFIATKQVINSRFADREFCAKCAEIAGIEGVKVHKTVYYWEKWD